MGTTTHTIKVNADVNQAKATLQDLQAQLQSLASVPVGVDATGLQSAKASILELGQSLRTAMNPNTGKLDLSVFSRELKASNKTILDYKNALFSMGTQGQQAFLTLANTIASAEAPTNRLNQKVLQFGKTLKNTINWQLSSSLIHGIIGQVQKAINYAEKLNTSLNNIQIVTGQNNEKMAEFAKQANQTAKQLSTTTTEYTNASLIYYQQGLSDKEVAKRTETTLKLANVTRQSAQTVSDQMTAIWNNYAEGSDNLEHYADVITALGAATASSSAEIAGGLEKFAAISKTVGLSYNYATTALATIVATTRQSEETVGTGLRTLFSRLEGLSLGETLEDGVNLNKYSSALAKVGVNITDQYGKIKDMDNILDELGAKWGTISKEQQIALAQTVGGVRQYTNLIALMDNWDKFQKNLKVAEGADGTLQAQEERYATSWEAARKRVQASAEGIYDSLIDDQAIIKVTNVFAGFLDVVNGLVDGFGGLKVIIPTVLALLANSAAKNMPQFLNDIGNNMRVLFNRSQKDMTNMQGTLGDTLIHLRNNTTDEVYQAQLNKIIDTNTMNRSLALNANRMSDADKAAYQFKIAQREMENDARIMAAQEKQKNEQQYRQLLENQKSNTVKELGKYAEAKSQRGTLTSSRNTRQNTFNEAEHQRRVAQGRLDQRRGTAEYQALSQEIKLRQDMLRDSSLTAQHRNEITRELRNLQKAQHDYTAQEELAVKEANKNLTVAKSSYEDAKNKYDANEAIITKGEEQGTLANQLLVKNGVDVKALLKQYDIKGADKLSKQMITEETLRQYRSGGILASNDREFLTRINEGYYKGLRENQYARGFLNAGSAKINAFAQESKDLFNPDTKKIDQQAFTKKANEFAESWQNAVNSSNLNDKIKQSLQIDPAMLMPDQKAFDGSIDQFSQMLETKLSTLRTNISKNLKNLGIEESSINDILTKLGLSSNIEGIAQNAQAGGAAAFLRGYMLPKRDKSEEAKPTQAISTSLTQVASAAMTLYTAFQSASNAVQSFSKDTSNGLSQFGTVLSAVTSGLMSAGMAGNAIKGLGGGATSGFAGFLTAAGPWVGIVLAIGAAILGIIDGIQKQADENIKQQLQETYDKADDSYERLTQSAELNKSQANLINAYNQTADDLKRGQATQKELEEAQKALIESLNSNTESGYNNSNAIGAALAGNTKQVQHIIDQNRKQVLETERQYAIIAADRAQTALLTGKINKTGITKNYTGNQYDKFGLQYGYSLKDGGNLEKVEISSLELLDLYADSFKKLHREKFGVNDVANIGNLEQFNLQDYLDYYNDLKTFKDLIESSQLTAGNEIYDNVKSQITALSSYLDMYLQYEDQIKESNLEYLMLGGTLSNNESVNIQGQNGIIANEYIKDLETYNTYRQSLIDLLTEGLKEGTKEYNDEVAKIDAALGVLPSVTNYEKGNLQYISKGIQSIVDNQIQYQQDYTTEDKKQLQASVKQLYDKYQDAIFDWNYTIKIPLDLEGPSDSAFQAQLKAIEAKAQANKIKLVIDATTDFKLDLNSSYADMAAFAKQMNASLDINNPNGPGAWQTYSGTGQRFSIASFFALSNEQRENLIRQMNIAAIQDYYKSGGAFENNIIAQSNLSRELNQNAIDAANYYKTNFQGKERVYAGTSETAYTEADILAHSAMLSEYFNKSTAQTRKDAIKAQLMNNDKDLAGQHIGQLLGTDESGDSFIQALLDANNAMQEASLAASNQASAIAELRQQQQAYKANEFRVPLMAEANAWGINYDEVQQYANQLREMRQFDKNIGEDQYQTGIENIESQLQALDAAYANGILKEEDYREATEHLNSQLNTLNEAYNADIEASERVALIQMRLEKGVETLSSNWSTWKKTLKEATKNTWESNSAFLALRKSLANILNRTNPEELSNDFIELADALGFIDKAAKGTKEGTEALQKFAFQATALENAGTDLSKIKSLNEFEGAFTQFLGTLNLTQDQFNTFAESVKNTEIGMPVIDTTGFIASFTQAQMLAGKSLDSIKAMFAGFGVNLDAEWVPITSPEQVKEFQGIVGTSTTDENGAVTITYQPGGVSEAQISEGIAYGLRIGNNSTKTGGGDFGGKGGGGGGKKEPHKIKRYRNIENQIQNNNRSLKAASRNKDRAVGTAKLEYLEKERELREENLKLEQQYQKEIEDWLDKDRDKMMEAFAAINFTPIFDEAGEVINNDAFELAFEAIGDGSDEAWKKAEEALAQYEETLDKLNDKLEEIQELQDAIYDAALEATKLKLDLQLDISIDRFEYLDYLLDKIDDDAYQAAEAIALLGDKTAETMKKVNTYTTGLEDILSRHGFSLSDLDNLSVEDLNAAGFTQSEIDQIKEWRSELLKANQDLLEMRKTIIDKVINAFDDLNEKVQKSYDKFDAYNSVLEKYKNITDLMGRNMSAQSRQIMNQLSNTMLRNAQNTAAAARRIYEDAEMEMAQAQLAYQLAVSSGDQEAIRHWQEVIDATSEHLQEAEEQWLDSWNNALEQAKTMFEDMMEQIQEDYSATMGSTFGSLDYLQAAYDRQKEIGEMYERDFDRLYDLSKLSRDISKAIDDNDNIQGKQKLRALQAEINKLQADGTRLSEYDVEVLRKKFELEQARLALDDAQNAKSQVRLQRDANGNWGYVYTANEDKIAEAEQAYEDKLHEYQVLNDDYINQLQDKALEVQQTWSEVVGEIYSDLGLGVITDEEAAARLEEANQWLNEQRAYFEEQSNHALENQASLYDRTLNTYHVASAEIVDTWGETNLALLTKIDELQAYMNNWNEASETFLSHSAEVIDKYKEDIDKINDMAGISTTKFENHIDNVVVNINDMSDDTLTSVNDLSETMRNEFASALSEAVNWELQYVDAMDAMINRNETFVKSLNLMIEKLAGVNTSITEMLTPLETLDNIINQSTTPVYYQNSLSELTGTSAQHILSLLNANIAAYSAGLGQLSNPMINGLSTTIDQNVTITASFPNATNHSEIEEAFTNLINKASQYANRKGY